MEGIIRDKTIKKCLALISQHNLTLTSKTCIFIK